MGRIDLARDARTGLFAVPIMVVRTEVPQAVQTGAAFENETMFVDTGSTASGIGQEFAERLGIPINQPHRRGSYGIGGLRSVPVLMDFQFWVLEPNMGPVRVRLKEAAIVEDAEEEEMQRRGGMRRKIRKRGTGLSLFGLDSLEYLQATLTVRPHENSAHIEW